jgi:hypothetical protein
MALVAGLSLGGPIPTLFDFVRKNGCAPEIATRLDILLST